MYINPRLADASLMGWMSVRSRRAMSWHPMAVEGEDAQPPSHRGQHVYYKVDVDSISLGETVSTDADPLFVVVDDSVVWADIAVYKEDLSKVDSGMKVDLLRDGGGVLATGCC